MPVAVDNTNSIPAEASTASYDLEQQAAPLNKLDKTVIYLGRDCKWWNGEFTRKWLLSSAGSRVEEGGEWCL